MPYIHKNSRLTLADPINAPASPGGLNYVITTKIDTYLKHVGVSYSTINEVIGVLECAKLELYRRIAAPYEDKKLAENGDVYTV